jgi:hypothetical protein
MTYPKHMMATRADHKLGDISRDEPSLCLIEREDGDNYIGAWVTGFGFFDVKFPKATTRELTDSEADHFGNRAVRIGSGPSIPLKIRR